jgi:N-methylhydantoinase A
VSGTIVGIDVGGTYTDLIAHHDGGVEIIKVPSTPHQPQESVLVALELLAQRGVRASEVVHGATLGTNAVITRRGGRVVLLTTDGFTDVLEMRRRDRPRTYGLDGTFDPLVPRDRRLGVAERVRANGAVERAVDAAQVVSTLEAVPERPDAVAVCLLHAYRNPENELAVRSALEGAGFTGISLSHEVNPEMGEFERMSTVVINAFLQPVMGRYLAALAQECAQRGLAERVLILHGNGGAMTLDLAARFPARTVMSGPAGGVLAAQQLGLAAGHRNLLTCDMGGTSFDAAVIVDGQAAQSPQSQVEFGVPIRTAMTEVVTIGAGGGSLAWIDRGGLLQIGPDSAGADPGPVCYRRGGTRPTVTDANVVLGRINAERPIGDVGLERLDVDAAREAIRAEIADPLGLEVEQAAISILEIANHKMAGALRLISVERGHDPKRFVLVPFGGAGPLHTCALMRAVGMRTALVPPHPGITSAVGCLIAEFRDDRVRSLQARVADLDDTAVERLFAEETAALRREVAESGVDTAGALIEYACDASFEGQVHMVTVRLGERIPTTAELAEHFEQEYRHQFGSLVPGLAVVVRNLRVSLRVPRGSGLPPTPQGAAGAEAEQRRDVWFGDGWAATPIVSRAALRASDRLEGPLIVEQPDTTVVIEPGYTAALDELGNLVVTTNA